MDTKSINGKNGIHPDRRLEGEFRKKPRRPPHYYERIGGLGGKKRARRHSKEKLRKWGNLGGRPTTTANSILEYLKSGPRMTREICNKTGLSVMRVSALLTRLKRLGRMNYVKDKDVPYGKWQLPEKS